MDAFVQPSCHDQLRYLLPVFDILSCSTLNGTHREPFRMVGAEFPPTLFVRNALSSAWRSLNVKLGGPSKVSFHWKVLGKLWLDN